MLYAEYVRNSKFKDGINEIQDEILVRQMEDFLDLFNENLKDVVEKNDKEEILSNMLIVTSVMFKYATHKQDDKLRSKEKDKFIKKLTKYLKD